MYRFIQHKSWVKVFIGVVLLTFTTPAFALGPYPSRIIPTGTVAVYEGDTKVGEFTEEAPLPEGSMLRCSGKCGIKMNDTYMVAGDKSVFSISDTEGMRVVNLNSGKLYFALSALPQQLQFQTPAGIIGVEQLIMHAAANDNLLKGYLSANPKQTEVGVLEGGSMLVTTPEGEAMIKSGKRIILAQQAEEEDEHGVLFWGAITLGGGAAALAIINEINDDDDDDGSPSQ